MTPTADQILAAIQAAPTRFVDLAGPNQAHNKRRAVVRAIVADLIAAGKVRWAYINGIKYLTTPERRQTVADIQLGIDSRSKRAQDGCTEWIGNRVHGKPVVRINDGDGKWKSIVVRRWLWLQHKVGRLTIKDSIVPCCGNEDCIAVAHLIRRPKNQDRRGEKRTPVQRERIAQAVRAAIGKTNMEQALAIRYSNESTTMLMQRTGLSRSHLNQIRRGRIWREPAGMFSGLIGGGQ